MKLLEKLAEDYAKQILVRPDRYEKAFIAIGEEAYQAGFRAAREMAAQSITDLVLEKAAKAERQKLDSYQVEIPEICCRILALGEEEAEPFGDSE